METQLPETQYKLLGTHLLQKSDECSLQKVNTETSISLWHSSLQDVWFALNQES